MSERATPFYCPYCADEDLRPVEEPHGGWRCSACLRVFVIKFVGLSEPVPGPSPDAPGDPGGVRQGGGGANSGAIGDDDNAAGRRLGAGGAGTGFRNRLSTREVAR